MEFEDAAELKEGCMRHAKIVLVINLVMNLLMFMCFVLDVYYSSPTFKEHYPMGLYPGMGYYPEDDRIWAAAILIGFIIFMVVVYSLFFLGYSLFRRSFAIASIYLLIIVVSFTGSVLEMPIKGHMYAWFPQLCNHPLQLGRRASVCYDRIVVADEQMGDIHNIIVYNPDDEMSLPGRQWSSELKKEVGEHDFAERLATHIYLLKSIP